MSEKAKSYAFLAVGFAMMLLANFYFGETPLGWATVFAGLGIYYYGWRGVCPACQAGRCRVEPKDMSPTPLNDAVSADRRETMQSCGDYMRPRVSI